MKKLLLFSLACATLSCSKENKFTPAQTQITPNPQQPALALGDTIFTYNTELCTHIGVYKAGKYTPKQLQDTYTLWFADGGLMLNIDVPNAPKDLEGFDMRLTLEKLETEYKKIEEHFLSLKLVPGSDWEDLRQSRLRELEDYYHLLELKIQSFEYPEVLLMPNMPDCNAYALALNAGTTQLLAKWEEMVMESYERNGKQPGTLTLFKQERHSADSVLYARLNILNYGWGNCVNGHNYHFEDKGQYYTQFEKLFTDVTSECDEP